MLSDAMFHPMARPDESIVANEKKKNPSHVIIKGEEVKFLGQVCRCADQDNLVVRALKELGTRQGLHSNKL